MGCGTVYSPTTYALSYVIHGSWLVNQAERKSCLRHSASLLSLVIAHRLTVQPGARFPSVGFWSARRLLPTHQRRHSHTVHTPRGSSTALFLKEQRKGKLGQLNSPGW